MPYKLAGTKRKKKERMKERERMEPKTKQGYFIYGNIFFALRSKTYLRFCDNGKAIVAFCEKLSIFRDIIDLIYPVETLKIVPNIS